MIKLRPYQEKAVNEIRGCLSRGDRAILFVLPTGGGKTFTFVYIAQNASQKGKRVLILAHIQELVMQASLSLAKMGVKHSLVAAASTIAAIKVQHMRELGVCLVDSSALVCVGSIQTVVNKTAKMPYPDLIICDEAHHSPAGQWKKVIDFWDKARVLGVTATPIRTDGVGLGVEYGGIFDSIVCGPNVQSLIDMGSLVPPKVFCPVGNFDFSDIKISSNGDYNQKELAKSFADKPSLTGNAISHYKKFANGKKCVVFCVSVAAAQAQAEAFNQAGFRFMSLDGTLDDSQRRKAVRDLTNGDLDGLTSCQIISEGFDLPAIEVVILMRPTKSLGLFLQQIGRGLRPSQGKNFGLVIDMVGNTITHGLPQWEQNWTLEGRPKKAKKNEVEPVLVKVCEKCFSVQKPSLACISCGEVFKVKPRVLQENEGELQEMTKEMEEAFRLKKRSEVGKAKTIEDLNAIEISRGYKKGWAHHVFKSRNR